MTYRISTAYNVTSSYDKYKEKLSSSSTNVDSTSIIGCDNFSLQHINFRQEDFPDLCSTVIKFLIHLEQNSDTYRDEECKYLYYWLYVEKLNRTIPMEKILILYKELNNIFNNSNNGSNSLDNYINQMNINTSDKLVKLTDLYNKFNQFMGSTKETNPEENCQSDCFDLYTSYVKECKNGDDNDFCYELKNFRAQHNTFIQTMRNCKGEQYFLPPVDILDTTGIILISFTFIMVTSFLLPLLYKFTPLGPWIYRKLIKRKNIWNNISQEENHLSHNYEMDKDDSKKHHYKLAYNSS
ncbi:PIR Superfamily Protein [Plasmodium ovale wallikeri]|uniref:PIR Superfamily Protein n=1 Tax=Plasmodium ovale wallikeri TaxID=864142 RepID=A0A1A9AD72_PLAOA|nr:PIR Superfamily Protein [Plasmodium ovale wallikeri]SBT54082.1 PIR Superfamily Protein [Plasmodium ovale wallikeri]